MKKPRCINKGNKNAVKEVKRSSVLTIRCTPQEKKAWGHQAQRENLSKWVVRVLNQAVGDADKTNEVLADL